jgi:hypothetical protein
VRFDYVETWEEALELAGVGEGRPARGDG